MNQKNIILLSFFLFLSFYIKAQSDFLWSIHTDFGFHTAPTYTQNNLSKKFLSPTMGLSTSGIYRWKDLISLEIGVGQHFSNLRFKDNAFEALNDGFSVKYNNKNSYWNYYGALRLNIPLSDYTFIYTQMSYSINQYGGGSETQEKDFIFTEQQKDQTVLATSNYSKNNTSYIPEIGIQQKLDNGDILSFGFKMNLGQSEVMNGEYSVTDNLNNSTIHTDNVSSKGNFISLNLKYALLLHHIDKKSKKVRGNEVTVCHLGKTKKIPISLLSTHLAHGDTQGGCPKTKTTSTKTSKENTVTVCHLGKRKKIPESLLKTHLAHGDTKGDCKKKAKEEEIYVCHLGKNKKIRISLLNIHLGHGDTQGKCPKKGKEPKTPKKGKEELKTAKDGTPKTLNKRKVVKGNTIYVKSTTLTFKIWDSGKEIDGDTISLNLNGKWIAENVGLTREKQDVKVTINKDGKNFLMLYALNLGKYPPNTAAVSVWDGEQEQILELKSDLKTCGSLNIIFKP